MPASKLPAPVASATPSAPPTASRRRPSRAARALTAEDDEKWQKDGWLQDAAACFPAGMEGADETDTEAMDVSAGDDEYRPSAAVEEGMAAAREASVSDAQVTAMLRAREAVLEKEIRREREDAAIAGARENLLELQAELQRAGGEEASVGGAQVKPEEEEEDAGAGGPLPALQMKSPAQEEEEKGDAGAGGPLPALQMESPVPEEEDNVDDVNNASIMRDLEHFGNLGIADAAKKAADAYRDSCRALQSALLASEEQQAEAEVSQQIENDKALQDVYLRRSRAMMAESRRCLAERSSRSPRISGEAGAQCGAEKASSGSDRIDSEKLRAAMIDTEHMQANTKDIGSQVYGNFENAAVSEGMHFFFNLP